MQPQRSWKISEVPCLTVKYTGATAGFCTWDDAIPWDSRPAGTMELRDDRSEWKQSSLLDKRCLTVNRITGTRCFLPQKLTEVQIRCPCALRSSELKCDGYKSYQELAEKAYTYEVLDFIVFPEEEWCQGRNMVESVLNVTSKCCWNDETQVASFGSSCLMSVTIKM